MEFPILLTLIGLGVVVIIGYCSVCCYRCYSDFCRGESEEDNYYVIDWPSWPSNVNIPDQIEKDPNLPLTGKMGDCRLTVYGPLRPDEIPSAPSVPNPPPQSQAPPSGDSNTCPAEVQERPIGFTVEVHDSPSGPNKTKSTPPENNTKAPEDQPACNPANTTANPPSYDDVTNNKICSNEEEK